jgi:hypothetical protein
MTDVNHSISSGSGSNMNSSSTTTFVYIQSNEHAWLPARIVESNHDTVTVSVSIQKNEQLIGISASSNSSVVTQVISLKDYIHHSLPLQNVMDTATSSGQQSLRVVADLADLSFLHEVRFH